MSTIRLKKIDQEQAVINIHVNLDSRGSAGYETDIIIKNINTGGIGCDQWVAEMSFTEMPPQSSPEDAVERMGLYLTNTAKAMKGRNIKHIGVGKIFKPMHK